MSDGKELSGIKENRSKKGKRVELTTRPTPKSHKKGPKRGKTRNDAYGNAYDEQHAEDA